jgi:hypothetical protein
MIPDVPNPNLDGKAAVKVRRWGVDTASLK